MTRSTISDALDALWRQQEHVIYSELLADLAVKLSHWSHEEADARSRHDEPATLRARHFVLAYEEVIRGLEQKRSESR